jgi:GTP cyclohydrolase IB
MLMDSQPLIDVQSHADTRGIALQKVGVKNVELPLHVLQKDGHTQMVAASVTMSVSLPEEQKGTHLSRFIIQLAEQNDSIAFCYNLKQFLEETQRRLDATNAYIKMDFRYFIQKKAPISLMSAPMAVSCSFEASLHGTAYQFALGLEVPIATLCPCSKAISDYGAHNQRAMIRTRMLLDTQHDHQVAWIEDLVAALDECASCPVYPILKRTDEKYVTERAYDNPKFVEDVIRECVATLRQVPSVKGFEVEVEALESIHGHNAWASQNEGFSGL